MDADLLIEDLPSAARGRPSQDWADGLLDLADRHRRWLLAGLVFIYLLGINGQWRIEPDSALYLSLARNIANGQGYTYHGKPSATAYPGLPYALSVVFRMLPAAHRDPLNLVAENILMPLVGLATLGLTYRLIRLHAGRPTAVVVTCGVGLTRWFYRASFALMTDMPFLLGVMAFLTGYEAMVRRGWKSKRQIFFDSSLMVAGLVIAISMRPAWLALVPVAIIALIGAGLKGRISWKTAVVAAVVAFVTAAIFYVADPRRGSDGQRRDRYEDQIFNQLHPSQRAKFVALMEDNALDLVRQTGTSAMLGIKFGPAPDMPGDRHWYEHVGAAVNVVGALATLSFGVALWRRRALWGMWVAASILMMVAVQTNERYFLQILPLLIFAWWQALKWINRKLPLAAGNIIFGLLLGLGFVPNFCQVIGVIREQRTAPFLTHYSGGKYAPMVAQAQLISTLRPDSVILAPSKSARVLSYLSRHTVVEENDYQLDGGWPPDARQVFVLDDPANAKLQEWLTNLKLSVPPPTDGTIEIRRVPRSQYAKQPHQ
jgi:hypothetical protein